MSGLQRGTEVGKTDTRGVFVCPIETNTFDPLAVYEAANEDHHYHEDDENEDYRRGDAHPLPESVVVDCVTVVVALVHLDTGFSGRGQGCGPIRWGCGRRGGGGGGGGGGGSRWEIGWLRLCRGKPY